MNVSTVNELIEALQRLVHDDPACGDAQVSVCFGEMETVQSVHAWDDSGYNGSGHGVLLSIWDDADTPDPADL